MLRKILIASSLVLASGTALALDEFPRPRVSITFGAGHQDYGHADYSHSGYSYSVPHYQEVYVPRPVHVQPIYYNNYYRGQGRPHGGWGERGYQRRYERVHHD